MTSKAHYLASATPDPDAGALEVSVGYVDAIGVYIELLTGHAPTPEAAASLVAERGWALIEPWHAIDDGLRTQVTWSGERLLDADVRAAMTDELTTTLARATALAHALAADEDLMDSHLSPNTLDML